MADMGLTFAPTDRTNTNQAAQNTPIQDAIRILSLRLPSFVGAASPIPGGLLAGPGAAGLMPRQGQAGLPFDLQEMIRRILMGGAPGTTGNGMAGGIPMPNVMPGQGPSPSMPMPPSPRMPAPSNPAPPMPGPSQPSSPPIGTPTSPAPPMRKDGGTWSNSGVAGANAAAAAAAQAAQQAGG